MHPKSLANLELGRKPRAIAKQKVLVTLLPDTIAWIRSKGQPSEVIEELVMRCQNGSLKRQ